MTIHPNWFGCEQPHRPVDEHTLWHDDCPDCDQRRHLDPEGHGIPANPSQAAVDAARARIAAGRPRAADQALLHRWDAARTRREPTIRPARREPSTTADEIRQAISDLERLLTTEVYDGVQRPRLDHALDRMRQARPGPAAVSYDGSGRAGARGSKPPPGIGDDTGGTALAETIKAHRAVARGARDLARKVDGWLPHEPSQSARDATAAEAHPECAHARATLGKFEPAYRTGDVDGRLKRPMPLCRWVYDFVLSNGRLPNGDEMARHDRGLRVMVKAT